MRICKPTKNCNLAHVTQGFSREHQAVDFAEKWGDVLVAPLNCKILRVSSPKSIAEYKRKWEEGCGVVMQSIEYPNVRFSYWHTSPILPVEEGDVVLEGAPVALVGNTGYVESNAEFVPVARRFFEPFPGTHVHFSMGVDGEAVDCRKYIDWNKGIEFDKIKYMWLMLLKIKNFIYTH